VTRRIYVPTAGAGDWRKLLAQPEIHWRTGYSARSLAYCWEDAAGFPPEVAVLFSQSSIPAFRHLELLLALPEHKVFMPPNGGHPSQNDIFVLAKDSKGDLISLTVEGKVSEPFGPTVGAWYVNASPGKITRLAFLRDQLGLPDKLPAQIRYQLLHRTTSALVEAVRFNARSAAMIVHSFRQDELGFGEYQAFLNLFGVSDPIPGQLYFLNEIRGLNLYSGWVQGNNEFTRK
jgi:hypothetical protein